jgi:ABC-type Fe3+/spermidine/putrescine transport system ATPase subunit
MMPGLNLQDLTSGYGGRTVLQGLSLEVGPRETLVLMGPSGSGKTTLLLTILGIVKPESGKIILDGREINRLEIEERNIGYVPQDYGLFPHMTVINNVGYGRRIRGQGKAQRDQAAEAALNLVGLSGFEGRKIGELSGGQKQRVALARALAIKPDLLLLDEPLSNIDQVTKLEVAGELKALFKKLEAPIILVTHNHEDALFLAERLAIMIDGRIEQIGGLKEITQSPKSLFIKRLLMPFQETD